MPTIRSLVVPLLVVSAGCGRGGPEGPPNLLLVSIDTLRADALGVYGSERGATPFLDGWSKRGVVFSDAWSHSAKTAPSHMTMFTGLPPSVHGVRNLGNRATNLLSPRAVTLAETLRARGFRTAAFTSGVMVTAKLGFDRGFDDFDDTWTRMEDKVPDARAWLERFGSSSDRPWFLFFHTYQVHAPYFPPPELASKHVDPGYSGRIVGDYAELRGDRVRADFGTDVEGAITNEFWDRFDGSAEDLEHLRSLYLACVEDVDRQLEELFGWMEARGMLENTVVVITSDHGEEFGEHGSIRHNQLWREHLQVPLLVRLPGDRAAGAVVAAPVGHVDLTPSVLELLGVRDTTPLRLGASWAAWIDGAEPDWEKPLLAERHSRGSDEFDLWAIRHRGWLLLNKRNGDRLLVDRRADPHELDLVEDPSHEARLEELVQSERERLRHAAFQFAAEVTQASLDPASRRELEALGYL